MTEDDVRAVVRAIKESQAEAFSALESRLDVMQEAVDKRFDALERHTGDMEAGWVNLIRDLSKRIGRLESAGE